MVWILGKSICVFISLKWESKKSQFALVGFKQQKILPHFYLMSNRYKCCYFLLFWIIGRAYYGFLYCTQAVWLCSAIFTSLILILIAALLLFHSCFYYIMVWFFNIIWLTLKTLLVYYQFITSSKMYVFFCSLFISFTVPYFYILLNFLLSF